MVGLVAGERNQFQLFDRLTSSKYVGCRKSGSRQTWGKSSDASKSSLRFIAMSEDERGGTLRSGGTGGHGEVIAFEKGEPSLPL